MSQVAVIGAGYWGKNLVRNFHDVGALAAVCDASVERLNQMKETYPDVDYRGRVEDVFQNPRIPAVVISTPAEKHAGLVKQALLAGKDVFVEKPMALDIETGKDLVALAKEKKKILMVGHLLWYHQAILKLKELIYSGELGRIRYIYSNRLNLGKIRQEENILWSFAPHDISVILGLLNEMPSQVLTQGGNYLKPSITDVTMSFLDFPSGKKAHIFVSWLHPFKEQKLVVVGERKMAVFNDLEKENKLLLYPHIIEWQGDTPVLSKAEADVVPVDSKEPLRSECEHFLECIRTRHTPRTNGEEALRVLTVLQQCEQSLENFFKQAIRKGSR